MRKQITSLALFSFATLGLGACTSDPPSPTTVRSRISSDLGNVLHASASASDGATAMLPTSSFDVMSKLLGQSGSTAVSNFMAAARPSDPGDDEQSAFDPDAIIEELNTKIFTDDHEVEPGFYVIPADLVCNETTFDDSGNEIQTLDPDCAASWVKLQLRIRVEENDSKLVFGVQIGGNHDEPLSVALAHDSIAVSVDLDEAGDAAQTIATAYGEEAPNAALSGKVTGTLTVLGAAHVGLALSVDRALDIAVADHGAALTGPEAFRLTSAASHVVTLDLDGAAKTGSAALALGATALHIPGDDGFDLDLPGASATVAAAANQPLSITNISLGDRTTTVSKNGAVGLSIDLNPADGRKLDASITSDANGETIGVTPKLDARIATNHTVLGDEMGRYDVTRVLLDGSLHSSDASDQIKVVTGTFSITTNPADYGFSATAGQCVSGQDNYDETTCEDYTTWTVGSCALDFIRPPTRGL